MLEKRLRNLPPSAGSSAIYAGAEVNRVLQDHPKLLVFQTEQGRNVLCNGKARAEAYKASDGKVVVSMYREGAFRRGLSKP